MIIFWLRLIKTIFPHPTPSSAPKCFRKWLLILNIKPLIFRKKNIKERYYQGYRRVRFLCNSQSDHMDPHCKELPLAALLHSLAAEDRWLPHLHRNIFVFELGYLRRKWRCSRRILTRRSKRTFLLAHLGTRSPEGLIFS